MYISGLPKKVEQEHREGKVGQSREYPYTIHLLQDDKEIQIIRVYFDRLPQKGLKNELQIYTIESNKNTTPWPTIKLKAVTSLVY